MFADVHSRLKIVGTATGEDLDYFRVLIGKGLNPQNWIQIGEDEKSPVLDGTLATWDTSGLNGLYAVQLQVVRADQRVDNAVIQVTIDNVNPEVNISYPRDRDEFDYSSNQQITFQAQASDNLSIALVEFYIDGELVGSVESAPFAYPWNLRRGAHELSAWAYDRAGNLVKESIRFSVR
jgi:hypothetical protein